MNNCTSISRLIEGPDAFYNARDYNKRTEQELKAADTPAVPCYNFDTESRVWRVVKCILSTITFNFFGYGTTHKLLGNLLVPSTSADVELDDLGKTRFRRVHNLNSSFKIKRISIRVNGSLVDAMIVGKSSTLHNKRWTVFSNGNREFYEERIKKGSFKSILSNLNSNAIVFNYPGVGASEGLPNRRAMTNAYKAILTMLEDKKHGLGAKEIIGYGFSIGGGVQGDALRTHHLKSDVKYTFVKDRTFSSFSSITSSLLHHSVGFIVWFFGWNFSSRRSSMNLKAPEVIIQRAEVTRYTDIQTKRELIVDDGIITPKASLAGRLLRDKHSTYENKSFVGVPEDHNTDLENVRHITRLIESKLASA